jgi:hypothetical protein
MYKEKFKHLHKEFQGYAILQTEIMVTRILDITTESSKLGFVTGTVLAGLMFPTLQSLPLNSTICPMQTVCGSQVHLVACLARARESWKGFDLL